MVWFIKAQEKSTGPSPRDQNDNILIQIPQNDSLKQKAPTGYDSESACDLC